MSDVRAECKRRFPGPCIRVYAPDMVTVIETSDCTVWCPALNRSLVAEESYANLVNDAGSHREL